MNFTMVQDISKRNLTIDQAQLNIISTSFNSYTIWTQREDCYKCDLEYKGIVFPYDNAALVLDTSHNVLLELRQLNSTVCSKVLSLTEHGVYSLNLTRQNVCPDINVTHKPDAIYEPLYIMLGLYLCFLSIWFFGKLIYRARWFHKVCGRNPVIAEIENDLGSPNSSNSDSVALLRSLTPSLNHLDTPQTSRARVRSLDVLRGLSICLMVFVNYGGGRYAMFEHSAWNGVTVADFVYPWFVWIMGVSLTFSLCSKLRSGCTRAQLFLGVLQRSFYLIILGILLSNKGNLDLSALRYTGVLQRLGVAYFFVASIETILMRTQPIFTYDAHGKLYHIRDFIESWQQWIFAIIITIIHTLITFSMDVPNCPTGYLGPGGLSEHAAFYNCTGGAAGYIDRVWLGTKHLYSNPTCKQVYKTVVPFDPEGLLGTLTTILLMFLGVYAGRVMLCFQKTSARIIRWMVAALILGLVGGFLCGFSRDGGLIPLNKNLWSLSFVFVTASTSFVLLSCFLFIVDDWRLWSGSPFHQAGKNAIFIYIGHILCRGQIPWAWAIQHKDTHAEYTIMNAWGTLLWVLISIYMYEKKCFFKV